MSKPETRFKNRIRPWLEALPRSWWVKTQMVSVLGIPDFIGCLNGVFIALELKRDGKSKPSALQAHVLQKIRAAGGIGLVVDPETWAETQMLLSGIGDGNGPARDEARAERDAAERELQNCGQEIDRYMRERDALRAELDREGEK